jgi:hypothetical protein
MNRAHFAYTFISWWTLGLFTLFGYYEWCFCKHSTANFIHVFCMDIYFPYSWTHTYEGSCWIVGSYGNFLNFSGTARLFPPAVYEGSSSFTSLPVLVIWLLNGYEGVSHCSFDLHFLDDVEKLFTYLLSISVSSLRKCLLRPFAYFN